MVFFRLFFASLRLGAKLKKSICIYLWNHMIANMQHSRSMAKLFVKKSFN